MYQQKRLAAELDYDGFYELDEAFHSMICDYGASLRIWKIVYGAKGQLDRVRRLAFPLPMHLETVLTEHAAIADGLRLESRRRRGNESPPRSTVRNIRTLLIERRDFFTSASL